MPRTPRDTRVPLPYLRDWRIYKDLSQTQLAELSHVTKTTISHLENGNQSANLLTVSRLARGLGISRRELLSPPPEA